MDERPIMKTYPQTFPKLQHIMVLMPNLQWAQITAASFKKRLNKRNEITIDGTTFTFATPRTRNLHGCRFDKVIIVPKDTWPEGYREQLDMFLTTQKPSRDNYFRFDAMVWAAEQMRKAME